MVTIAFIIICVAGFVFLLFKRKLRDLDKAVFLTGMVYSISGIFLYLLGSRAIALAFIPISLGLMYWFEGKLRPYLKCSILILLILLPFIPLHSSFDTVYQTNEVFNAENFFIDHHAWTNPDLIVANFRVTTYLAEKQASHPYSSDPGAIKEVDTIFYTISLGKDLLGLNYSMEKIVYEEKLNMLYDNGYSYVATRSWNFTWAPVKP
jgi:hypothetical protein